MRHFLALIALAALVTAPLSAFATRPIVSGQLIKCPDFSSVYYISEQDERWVFPDEKTYFTWFMDFDDVTTVSCAELANYPVRGLVPYQAGTNLLKLQSNPNVYAVEPGGVLRMIQTEADAIDLYGSLWWTRVRDLPEGFWGAYTVGAPLEGGEYPVGTTFWDRNDMDPPSSIYYYFDGTEIRDIREYIDEVMNDWTAAEISLADYDVGDPMNVENWLEIKQLSH